MLSSLTPAVIILLFVATGSAILLVRDVNASRLRERVFSVRYRNDDEASARPVPSLGIRSADDHSNLSKRLMHALRLNPDNPQQNALSWKVVIAIACALGLAGFFYGRAFVGWPLAALTMPIETFLVARVIFGWERTRYRKTVLEQLPDVMALICRAVGAGIPLSEALRSVVTDAPTPSHEAFVHVVNGLAIGQRLEDALWKLYERVGLPEYAFFAVTISLQAQTGGSLIETLQNLQDIVRKRVQLSKRGKAMAAEARSSAMILGALPFVLGLILSYMQPGFLNFFFNTPGGNHLLLSAFGLLGTGLLVMRQLICRSLAP